MRKIQGFQIKKIYAIANALGLAGKGSEDELHDIVAGATGKSSIKTLSYYEAENVIIMLDNLKHPSTPIPKVKKRKKREEVAGGVTEGQQRKIWYLMYQLKENDVDKNDIPLGERLCKVIKKETGIDSHPKNPFIWIDYKAGNKLIEVLKHYVKSAEKKKRGDADGVAED